MRGTSPRLSRPEAAELHSHLLWFMSSSRCSSWWLREAFTGFSSFLGLMSSGFHSLYSGRAIRPPMSARSLWISEYMEAVEVTGELVRAGPTVSPILMGTAEGQGFWC